MVSMTSLLEKHKAVVDHNAYQCDPGHHSGGNGRLQKVHAE